MEQNLPKQLIEKLEKNTFGCPLINTNGITRYREIMNIVVFPYINVGLISIKQKPFKTRGLLVKIHIL